MGGRVRHVLCLDPAPACAENFGVLAGGVLTAAAPWRHVTPTAMGCSAADASSGALVLAADKARSVRSVAAADDEVLIKQMQDHLLGRVHALPPSQQPPPEVVAAMNVSFGCGGSRAGAWSLLHGWLCLSLRQLPSWPTRRHDIGEGSLLSTVLRLNARARPLPTGAPAGAGPVPEAGGAAAGGVPGWPAAARAAGVHRGPDTRAGGWVAQAAGAACWCGGSLGLGTAWRKVLQCPAGLGGCGLLKPTASTHSPMPALTPPPRAQSVRA